MSSGQLFWLVLMGAVFALWAAMMFRTLFRLRRIAVERQAADGGGLLRYYGHVLQTFRDFAIRPMHRGDRTRLILVTLLLFALIACNALLMPFVPG